MRSINRTFWHPSSRSWALNEERESLIPPGPASLSSPGNVFGTHTPLPPTSWIITCIFMNTQVTLMHVEVWDNGGRGLQGEKNENSVGDRCRLSPPRMVKRGSPPWSMVRITCSAFLRNPGGQGAPRSIKSGSLGVEPRHQRF